MDLSDSLSGSLEHDATGLWLSLPRSLPDSDIQVIARLYRLLFQEDAILESDFPRPSGVSFNPRPARVLKLAQEFLLDPPFETLCAALLLGANRMPSPAPTLSILGPKAAPALTTAQTVKQLLIADSECTTPTERGLAAIYLLDEVRHFHLRPNFEGLGAELVAKAEHQFKRLRTAGIPSQLEIFLEAALRRCAYKLN